MQIRPRQRPYSGHPQILTSASTLNSSSRGTFLKDGTLRRKEDDISSESQSTFLSDLEVMWALDSAGEMDRRRAPAQTRGDLLSV